MRKIWTIASRDYQAAIRTKSFLVSLLMMPLLMVGSAFISNLVRKQTDIEAKRIAVVDHTLGGIVFPELQAAAERHNKSQIFEKETGKQVQATFELVAIKAVEEDPKGNDQLRFELSERVLNREFFGFLEIGPDVCKLSPPGETDKQAEKTRSYLRYQTNHPTYRAFVNWATLELNTIIMKERMKVAEAQIPAFVKVILAATMKQVGSVQPVAVQTMGLSKKNAATGQIEDPPVEQLAARLLVPIGLVLLMFMVVILGSTPAMQGIVEEKAQRIAEVLLASVTPFTLMMGKLLGLTGVSLTITAVYLGGAYAMAYHYGVTEFLPADILAWFLLFQIAALMMYGSLFLAVGAAASDIKETQTLMMPLVLVMAAPLMVLQILIENPNNNMAAAASYFPFVTPMLMMARIAVPPGVAWWQPALGMLIVLATSLLCVYAAGRIFRVGILMQGKGPKFSDLLRWVIQG